MTGPVVTPVVFFVAGSDGARQELAFCGAIPQSRRFREGFLGKMFFVRKTACETCPERWRLAVRFLGAWRMPENLVPLGRKGVILAR